jgi:hypothetical protein
LRKFQTDAIARNKIAEKRPPATVYTAFRR